MKRKISTLAQGLLSPVSMMQPHSQRLLIGFGLLLAVNSLAACAEKSDVPNRASLISTQEVRGTGDLGGGNGLNGKVLESYIIDVEKMPEYIQYIEPIKERVKTMTAFGDKSVTHGENRRLLDIFNTKRKTWYLAPVSLASLKKGELGLDFITDPIQQIALQNNREIWIDDRELSQDPRERARLYLHEMVMNYYMLQFESLMSICKTNWPAPNCTLGGQLTLPAAQEKNPVLIELQAKLDRLFAPKARRALNADDYANIRKATDVLFNQISEVETYQELESFFMNNNFDRRLLYSDEVMLEQLK